MNDVNTFLDIFDLPLFISAVLRTIPYAMRRILEYDRSEPNCLELISYQKLLLLLFQVIVNCDTIHMSLMGVCEV